MKNGFLKVPVLALLLLSWSSLAVIASAQTPSAVPAPVEQLGDRERCPVCGMFVARYPAWITQLHRDDGKVLFFDGMKDLLAYHFNPAAFGGEAGVNIKALWVKDYYTLQWIDGRIAYYVIGSQVYGPMGNELIPLESEEKARAFMRDHQGKQILRFNEITPEMVQSLRGGHTMGRGH